MAKRERILLIALVIVTICNAPLLARAASASLRNPEIKLFGTRVKAEVTVSGAPAGGMQVTMIVMQQTESNIKAPPIGFINPDLIFIDQQTLENGRHLFEFTIEEKLAEKELLVFFGGDSGVSVVFADSTGIATPDESTRVCARVR